MASKAPGGGDITFVAVGRVPKEAEKKEGGEPKVVAFYNREQHETQDREAYYIDVFKKLLHAAGEKLKRGARQRLQWGDGAVCILMDQQGELLYCVYTASLTYPEPLCYNLLYDIITKMNEQAFDPSANTDEIQKKMKPQMEKLVDQYMDPENFPMLHNNAAPDVSTGGAPGSSQIRRSGAGAAQEGGMNQRTLALGAVAIVVILILFFFVMKMMGGGKKDDGKAVEVLAEATSQIHSLVQRSAAVAADQTKEHNALRGGGITTLV